MLGEKGAVMTTLEDVARKKAEQSAEQKAAVELVRLAQEQGLSLTGPDGLLKQLTKAVLETALNEEMTEHLGYEKHDPPEAGTGNIRNGTRSPAATYRTSPWPNSAKSSPPNKPRPNQWPNNAKSPSIQPDSLIATRGSTPIRSPPLHGTL